MRVVWKYTIGFNAPQVLHVPQGAKLLTVSEQGRFAQMWFEVNPKAQSEPRTFVPVLTGMTFGDDGVYVGTALFDDGEFVVHYYEVTDGA